MTVFTANGNGFTTSNYAGVSLRDILAGYELLISMNGKIGEAKGDPRWALVYGARVSVQSKLGLKYLGFAPLHTPYRVQEFPNAPHQNYQIEFRLDLSPHQLTALEDHRGGGDVDFEVIVTCTTGCGAKITDYPEYPAWRIPASQSDWIRQLNGAKARNVVLLEVSMPAIDSPAHKRAMVSHLRRAEDHLMRGLYTDCVSECRKGLEALRAASPGFEWSSLQNRPAREGLSKDKRIDAVANVAYLYASPAGHTESEGGISNYTRSDAKLAMSVTAALLAYE